MPEIQEFDFGKDEIKITLGDDLGSITLDRNEGVLTFETKLRKLDIRLVEGAKFFLGEAAGYSDCVYIRLEMPPGYGPVRSLGRVKKGSQDGKLFVDVANICVPQSQPVFRSEADVPPRRRAVMRLALSVLLLAIAIGIFYYWISYRSAVRRRANLTAEAMAAYNRYHENLSFAPPFYDKPGPTGKGYLDQIPPDFDKSREKELAEVFISTALHRGRPTSIEEFVVVHKIIEPVYKQAGLEHDIVNARDAALSLIVVGQDLLLSDPTHGLFATGIQARGLYYIRNTLGRSDNKELIGETLPYLIKLSENQPSYAETIYGIRLKTEIKLIEYAKPLTYKSKPVGDSGLYPMPYNLQSFIADWERYRKTISDIEAASRKPDNEARKLFPQLVKDFDSLPDFFREINQLPFEHCFRDFTLKRYGLRYAWGPVKFDEVIKSIKLNLDRLETGK